MNEYMIIYEKTQTGYSAYSPDIEGCVAVGETEEEVKLLIKEAIEFHLEGLKMDDEEIPETKSKIYEMEETV